MNLFTLPITPDGVVLGDATIPLPRQLRSESSETQVVVGIRPEHLELSTTGIPMEVAVVEELGSDAYIYGRSTVNGETHQLVARADWRNPPRKGDLVKLHVDPAAVHLFSASGGYRLS
jgi:multiple sugar transport system ATP-binding protein